MIHLACTSPLATITVADVLGIRLVSRSTNVTAIPLQSLFKNLMKSEGIKILLSL